MNVTADIDVDDLADRRSRRHEPLIGWKSFHVGGLNMSQPADGGRDRATCRSTDFESRLVLCRRRRLEPAGRVRAAGPPRPPSNRRRAGEDERREAPSAAPPALSPPADAPMPITIGQARRCRAARSPSPIDRVQTGLLGGGDRSDGAHLRPVVGRAAARPTSTCAPPINRSGALAIAGQDQPAREGHLARHAGRASRTSSCRPPAPTPAKYVGYGISKGKLDLALGYKIASRKLDASNKLVLDQFTFGDKVDSPDAVKLPVRLAVALLKDRHGVIDVDLPIAGSLDDPEFKIWRAIVKVLGNLVVKAVTAPFSLHRVGVRRRRRAVAHRVRRRARRRWTPARRSASRRWPRRCANGPGISFEIEGSADPGAIARACGASSTSASSRRRSSPQLVRVGRRGAVARRPHDRAGRARAL